MPFLFCGFIIVCRTLVIIALFYFIFRLALTDNQLGWQRVFDVVFFDKRKNIDQ